MKILYYSPHPHLYREAPTGYGTHMREMMAAWRRMSVEVHPFIAGDRTAAQATGAPENGGKGMVKKWVPRIVWETLKDVALMRFDTQLEKELEEMVLRLKPDLIYERVAYLQHSGIRVAMKHGIRHVAEINAPYPEERVSFSGKSLLLGTGRSRLREILLHSDCVSTVSSALKAHLAEYAPEADRKVHVIPNSVNPESMVSTPEEVDKIRSTYDLDGYTVIGFVGSIFPYHGVDLLIEAFAELGDPGTKLLIVGDGHLIPELKALAHSKGVADRTVFTGSVPHRRVFSMIAAMDICCMARSNAYGSPVKIFEYGAMKKPVIAPDVVPVRDVMTESDAVWVQPTVESIRDAMALLTPNPDLRRNMAESWHGKVLENHTWDISAKKTLALCTSPS